MRAKQTIRTSIIGILALLFLAGCESARDYAGFPEGGDVNTTVAIGERKVLGLELKSDTAAIGFGFWWRRLIPTIEVPVTPADEVAIDYDLTPPEVK